MPSARMPKGMLERSLGLGRVRIEGRGPGGPLPDSELYDSWVPGSSGRLRAWRGSPRSRRRRPRPSPRARCRRDRPRCDGGRVRSCRNDRHERRTRHGPFGSYLRRLRTHPFWWRSRRNRASCRAPQRPSTSSPASSCSPGFPARAREAREADGARGDRARGRPSCARASPATASTSLFAGMLSVTNRAMGRARHAAPGRLLRRGRRSRWTCRAPRP